MESLRPHASTLADLKSAGINPDTDPNIRLLTAMDVIQRFSQAPLRREAIDPGMLMCMEALDQCLGMELTAMRVRKRRTGLFIPDFFNFSRTTETSGWRFQALILLVNGVVVHRSWGGEPNIHDVEITTNPLGPLQEIGPVLVQGR
ncbi:MAG: hypothetical protein FGM55_10335 [Rhodoferax sp.]|nr:hypothetical protein [Rhodoferax sp.]